MNVQLPDGTVLQDVPDGTTKAQIAEKLKANGRAVPDEWMKPKEEGYWAKVGRTGEALDRQLGAGVSGVAKSVVAAGENALSIGSGLVGDVAGAGTSLVTQDPKKGEAVRKAITTEPATSYGKAAKEYVGALTEPVSKALGAAPAALERGGHPIAAQAATAAEDVLLGRGGKFGDAAKTGATAAETAIKAGYKLKPSNAGASVGKVAEGLSGSARLGREVAVDNQKLTTRTGGELLGVPNAKVITPAAIKAAKAPHNAVYDEASTLGQVKADQAYHQQISSIGRKPGTSFPGAQDPAIEQLKKAYTVTGFSAADAVQETRKLRAAAKQNIKAREAPERNDLGYAQMQVSDALEAQLARHGQAIGKGDWVSRFQKARQSLAQIHSIENALVGTDLSAPLLAKQLRKRVPLTGKLKLIAETATEFPEEMRDASKLRDKTPVSVLEGVAAGGGAMALHNPAILAAMAARPATRMALRSKEYQQTLAQPSQLNVTPATQMTLATEESGRE